VLFVAVLSLLLVTFALLHLLLLLLCMTGAVYAAVAGLFPVMFSKDLLLLT